MFFVMQKVANGSGHYEILCETRSKREAVQKREDALGADGGTILIVEHIPTLQAYRDALWEMEQLEREAGQ
jgi:hypothetical protein